MVSTIVFLLITGVASLPPPVDQNTIYRYQSVDSSYEDDAHLVRRSRSYYIPSDFQRLYVGRDGAPLVSTSDESRTVEIWGSPKTSSAGMNRAAHIVGRMTRHMPRHLFDRLAHSGAGAGVFTREEKVTIFPEFSRYKNTPSCGNSCTGSCRYTCTGDKRKYDSLCGLGGKVGAVREDNVICTSRDQYRHKESIMIHEFAHTTKFYGLTPELSQEVDRAYSAAKQNATWMLKGYGMVSSQEYWAEGSEVFMGVSIMSAFNAAGMNQCRPTGPFCNEMEGRLRLKDKDPALYKVLVEVWTNGQPNLPMDITVCP